MSNTPIARRVKVLRGAFAMKSLVACGGFWCALVPFGRDCVRLNQSDRSDFGPVFDIRSSNLRFKDAPSANPVVAVHMPVLSCRVKHLIRCPHLSRIVIGLLVALHSAISTASGQTSQPLPRHGLYEDVIAEIKSGELRMRSSDPALPAVTNEARRLSPALALQVSNALSSAIGHCTIRSVDREAHLLTYDLNDASVADATTNGRVYIANKTLSSPVGLSFGAINNLGVFNIGDEAVMVGKTRLVALTPYSATIRLFLEKTQVFETQGTNLIYEAAEPGSYHIEASLSREGSGQPWLCTGNIRLRAPDLGDLRLPSMRISTNVIAKKDLTYVAGPPDDSGKHRLDVYARKAATNVPIFFFIHGGAWKSGDRSLYVALGDRLARAGYLAVLPSYRLAPTYKHPAQIEDVAAAFAWTLKHAREYGGDTNKIFVAGHSAGGHLAALLALDEHYLAAQGASRKAISGVIAVSGVYDLTIGDVQPKVFGKDATVRRAASPLFQVQRSAPPFLLAFAQWDYFTLPGQAREFYAALHQANIPARLLYIPHESHISEILGLAGEDDLLLHTALSFMKSPEAVNF